MGTDLNARVLDVNYVPLAADKAQAMFNNQSYVDMPKGQEDGTYTLSVPDGTTDIVLRVSKKDFFDVTQRLVLKQNPGKTVPSLEYHDNKQEINVRNLRVTRLGNDIHLDVFVVLGQLADATKRVNEEAKSQTPEIDLGLKPLIVRRRGTPILDPNGTGAGAIPSTPITVIPDGKLVFVERKTVPKLVAIYLPVGWWLEPNPYKEPEPGENETQYRVFFHPYITWDAGEYPYGWDYLDLIARYLLYPFENGQGKALVHQQESTRSQRVLVFPVGSHGHQMGELNSQANMMRLLQEINYWALRMDGVRYPIHTVGACAISGFSGGIDFVTTLFMKKKDKTFYENVLTDLYVFDGHNNQKNTGLTTSQCCRLFKKWFRQGGRPRTLRVYTQNVQWWNLLKDVTPAGSGQKPVITPGPKHTNAKEANTTASTVLHCPWNNFWASIDKNLQPIGYNDPVHQLIPARFMEHAAAHGVVPS
jgi:hypothetical protein